MASRISGIIPLLVITLICVGVVEGGYTILEYVLLRQPVKTVQPTVQTDKDRLGQVPAGAKAKGDHRIILARNLFGPSSSKETGPVVPAPDPGAKMEAAELGIVLVGTVNGSEGTERAIILDKKKHKQELYKVGDEIFGARIKEILRGKVILVVKGRDELLDMSEAAKVRPVVKITEVPPADENQEPEVAETEVAEGQPAEMEQPAEVETNEIPPPNKVREARKRRVVRPRIIMPSRASSKG